MKERWKPVVGYEGLYEVSDLGNVRSLKFGKVRVLKPRDNGNGYCRVVLCKDGKTKDFKVHRIVYRAFRGPIPAGMQVNHLNEDKRDNRLVNLELVTAKQNANHGTRNERIGKANSKAMLGNTNGNKQLQLTNVFTCAKYTFSSSYEASEFFSYKAKETIGNYIFKARKRGENRINIRGEKYYFVQQESEAQTVLKK